MPLFGLNIPDSGIFQLQANQFLLKFDQRQCGFDQGVLYGFSVIAGVEQTDQTFPNTYELVQRIQFRLVLRFRNMLNLIDKTDHLLYLKLFAELWHTMPMPAHTHRQPASPTSLG